MSFTVQWLRNKLLDLCLGISGFRKPRGELPNAILAQVNGLTWPKRYFLSHPKACLGGHSAVTLGCAFACLLGFLPPWLGSLVDGLPLWWAGVAWKSSILLFTIQHNGIH